MPLPTIMSTTTIHRPTIQIPHLLRPPRLRIMLPPNLREPILGPPRLSRRQEIDDKAPDIEDIDQRDHPLEDGAHVVDLVVLCHAEDDGEGDFGEDEEEFYPEGAAEDAEFAMVDPEALVFGADEDCAYDVAETGCC